MKLPQLAIKNYHFTIIVFILLSLFGITSVLTMPRSEDPAVAPAASNITVIYPGASPIDLENLVTYPIEEALNELDDIKVINSESIESVAVISIEFEAGSDSDEKYSDVVQKVNSVRGDLPDEVTDIDVLKWSTTDVIILQLALVSDTAEYRDLEEEAERLKRRLETVSGVMEVETMGYPETEVRVSADLERMASMQVPLGLVLQAIEMNNAEIPGGTVDMGSKRFSVKTSGTYSSLEEIRNTILHARGGNPVYLRDVADVRFDYKNESYRTRFNGRRSIFLTVTQKENTNIFNVVGSLRPRIEEFGRDLPPSIELEYVVDQTESVASRINGFSFNLLQGLVIVGLIVLLGVGLREAAIVMTAIPISFLIAIGFVDLAGYGLQQMSIVGLVIALGLLVDNAIVVTENVSRFLNQGYSHQEAAVKGTSQIGWAVVSATATTVLAFVPIVLMQDVTGDFIRSMPVTVIFTLIASLVVALTLTPYLASIFLKADGKRRAGFKKRIEEAVHGFFQRFLAFSLRRRVLVICLTVAVFALTFMLFPIIGTSLFPKAEKPQFVIDVEAPDGTSLDETDGITRYVESVLSSRPEVKHFATNIGGGNPRFYYNVIPPGENSGSAQFFVQLKRYDREEMASLIEALRSTFDGYPGATIEVKELQQGMPLEAPIAIKIIGEDLNELRKISREVERIIKSEPGTINVNNPLKARKTDLHVRINREKAGMLNIPIAEIDRTVRAGVTGLTVSNYRDSEGNEYDITVRLPVIGKTVLSDLEKISVSSLNGAATPLLQVASIGFISSPGEIDHYNLERAVTVTADVASGFSVDRATTSIVDKLDRMQWPKGYRYYRAGEQESRETSFGGMGQAFVIAVIAIFAVLVLQFRSYTQPLIVFVAIPLAIIGSVLALFLTGNDFSFSAFIGLTGLIGIVINNSILLVEYSNQLRDEGLGIYEAVRQAAAIRFKPILLTTMTTVGGLLPLTLRGGTLWAPFGWTIIGGLIVSTVLTLVVVPVFYTLFTKENGSTAAEAAPMGRV